MRPVPTPDLLAEGRRDRDDIVHLITLRLAVADDPVGLCPSCDHNIWWRLSVLRRTRSLAVRALRPNRPEPLDRRHCRPGTADIGKC
jgi:hypothetical protein